MEWREAIGAMSGNEARLQLVNYMQYIDTMLFVLALAALLILVSMLATTVWSVDSNLGQVT